MNVHVDYSMAPSHGGIGILVERNGKVLSHLTIRTKKYSPSEGEMLAFLLGMQCVSTGGTVLTDQLNIIDAMLEYGQIVFKRKQTQLKTKAANICNSLMLTKEGITIQYSKAHNGDHFSNLTDNLAKIASGCRQPAKGSPLDAVIGIKYLNVVHEGDNQWLLK